MAFALGLGKLDFTVPCDMGHGASWLIASPFWSGQTYGRDFVRPMGEVSRPRPERSRALSHTAKIDPFSPYP